MSLLCALFGFACLDDSLAGYLLKPVRQGWWQSSRSCFFFVCWEMACQANLGENTRGIGVMEGFHDQCKREGVIGVVSVQGALCFVSGSSYLLVKSKILKFSPTKFANYNDFFMSLLNRISLFAVSAIIDFQLNAKNPKNEMQCKR